MKIALIVISILLVPITSIAKMYKCTDGEGNISYTTSPCPTETQTEELTFEGGSGSNSGNKNDSNYDNGYYYEDPEFIKQNQQRGFHKKVKVISRGRLVDIVDYVEPGAYTAFIFYADWCAPCKTIMPKLENLARRADNFALRELDVINWQNPLVKYYNISSIPHFIVYGPKGNFVESGPRISKNVMNKISK